MRAGDEDEDAVGEVSGERERCKIDDRSEYEFPEVDSGFGLRCAGIGE